MELLNELQTELLQESQKESLKKLLAKSWEEPQKKFRWETHMKLLEEPWIFMTHLDETPGKIIEIFWIAGEVLEKSS